MKNLLKLFSSIFIFLLVSISSSFAVEYNINGMNSYSPTWVWINMWWISSPKSCEEIKKGVWSDWIMTTQEFQLMEKNECLPKCYYENENRECKKYYESLVSSWKWLTEWEFEIWKKKCCEDKEEPKSCENKLKVYLMDWQLSIQELIDLKRNWCLCKYSIEDFMKYNQVPKKMNSFESKTIWKKPCLDCLDEVKEVKKEIKINPIIQKKAEMIFSKIEWILMKKSEKQREKFRQIIAEKLKIIMKKYENKNDEKSTNLKSIFGIILEKLRKK